MSYAGNPANFPTSFPLPSDYVSPSAADFDVPFEALGDRTANVKAQAASLDASLTALRTFAGQFSAQHFPTATSFAGMLTAFYDKARRIWYLVGLSADVRKTEDFGLTWSASSVLAPLATSEDCASGASDASGNVVISTFTNSVFTLAAPSTWAKVNALGTVVSSADGSAVVFDPIHNLWSLIVSKNGIGYFTRTSSDRATWTTRPNPSSFSNVTIDGPVRMAVNPATGRIVAASLYVLGNEVRLAVSDDGGISWSVPSPNFIVAGAGTQMQLTFNEGAGKWMLITGRAGSPMVSEVWTSSDGLAWTSVAQLNTNTSFLQSAVGDGELWAGLACQTASGSIYEVVISTDGGATWERTGMKTSAAGRRIASGAGGFLFVTADKVYVGPRSGKPNLGVLT